MATIKIDVGGSIMAHDHSHNLKTDLHNLRQILEDYILKIRENQTLMQELSRLVEDLTCNTNYVIMDEEEEEWKAMIQSLNHLLVDQFEKIRQFLSVRNEGPLKNEEKHISNLVEYNKHYVKEFHCDSYTDIHESCKSYAIQEIPPITMFQTLPKTSWHNKQIDIKDEENWRNLFSNRARHNISASDLFWYILSKSSSSNGPFKLDFAGKSWLQHVIEANDIAMLAFLFERRQKDVSQYLLKDMNLSKCLVDFLFHGNDRMELRRDFIYILARSFHNEDSAIAYLKSRTDVTSAVTVSAVKE